MFNKFHAKKVFYDGIRFDSIAEFSRYKILKLMVHSGKISDFSVHPKFELPPGFKYTADFSYSENEKIVVEDVKGMLTRDSVLRMKCLVFFNPQLELRIIKNGKVVKIMKGEK